ncbi:MULTISPECIES: DUF397 domain-containing protein [unclassified Streptomyces]|uniref:DUF397 domain-containing protein n=1 Tax=unclassified Streptomyces TaxID=2593676 RepID=UPI00382F57FF
MNKVDLTGMAWIKSSRSNGQSACVEAALGAEGIVPVRDSKVTQGHILTFGPGAWSEFVTGVKQSAGPLAD